MITESEASTKLAEAGSPATDTYTVQLGGQPASDVVIAITPDAQQTVVPSSLTFTSTNWNVAQTVTVTVVDDKIDEADTHPGVIKHSLATTVSGWASTVIANVSPVITDNDAAGIIVTPTDATTIVAEGSTTADAVDVSLATQPLVDVQVTAATDAQLKINRCDNRIDIH